MKTTWVVVADEAIARILVKPSFREDLVPVEEMTDSDAHAKGADLRKEPHGRRSAGGAAMMGTSNATASAGDSELHLAAQRFAKQVAQRLETLHQQKRFDELHVVAAPRFLGYLRKSLSSGVEKAVVGSLDKDFIHLDNADITRRVFET